MNPSAVAFTPLAGRLPRMAPGTAAAARALHHRALAAGMANSLPDLQLMPHAGAPSGRIHRLTLETPDGVVEACLVAPGMASLEAGTAPSQEMTPVLRQLAAEALMLPVVEALQALGLAETAIGGLDAMHEPLPASGWMRIVKSGRPVACFAVTRAPAMLWRRLRRALPQPGRVLAPTLALRGRVTLAVRQVPRRVLSTLELHDVLLLDDGGLDEATDCRVSVGARGARCFVAPVQVNDTQLTLRGAGRMMEQEDDDLAGADGAAVPTLGDIDVPVRFEIDTVPLALSELEGMSAGYVIELAAPLADAPIRLVACGKVLGTAALVAVGDRLGARIQTLASDDAARSGD
jgi:type III secretion protein Q